MELIQVRWKETIELYPNQFVKFEIVEFHEDEKLKYAHNIIYFQEEL